MKSLPYTSNNQRRHSTLFLLRPILLLSLLLTLVIAETTIASSNETSQEEQQNAIVQSMLCNINSDCISTTFCCSTYSCVTPSVCLHGQKLQYDYCDYNFECLSRCCQINKCAHFLECYEKCDANNECQNTNCCSEGYCTHEIVCNGNKVQGDNCDVNEECISKFCFNSVCQLKATMFPLWMWIVIAFAFCLCLIIILIFFICCKSKMLIRTDLSLALDQYSDRNDKRQPLLQKERESTSQSLIAQNLSRKFLYNNPKKLPQNPIDQKFIATPILEEVAENQYYTYDARSQQNFQSMGSNSQRNLELTQNSIEDDKSTSFMGILKWCGEDPRQSFPKDHNPSYQHYTSGKSTPESVQKSGNNTKKVKFSDFVEVEMIPNNEQTPSKQAVSTHKGQDYKHNQNKVNILKSQSSPEFMINTTVQNTTLRKFSDGQQIEEEKHSEDIGSKVKHNQHKSGIFSRKGFTEDEDGNSSGDQTTTRPKRSDSADVSEMLGDYQDDEGYHESDDDSVSQKSLIEKKND